MKNRATGADVPFTPFDQLFEPTTPKPPELPSIDTLPITDLHPFADHPFHLYTDEKLRELTDSIREHGILMPILVRPLDVDLEWDFGIAYRKQHSPAVDKFIAVAKEVFKA